MSRHCLKQLPDFQSWSVQVPRCSRARVWLWGSMYAPRQIISFVGSSARGLPETQRPFERHAWPCATVSDQLVPSIEAEDIRRSNMWRPERLGCKLTSVSERTVRPYDGTNLCQSQRHPRWGRSSRQRQHEMKARAHSRVLL